MAKFNIKKIQGNLKNFIFVLRTDKESQIQARQFVLGILVCIALFWAGSTILLDPKIQKLKQLKQQLKHIKASSPVEVITTATIKKEGLDKQLQILQEKVDQLTLQSNLLLEHWDHQGDSDRFNEILFSPNAPAPEDIVNDLKLMHFTEPYQLDGFKVLPVVIEGDAEFADFYSYLQYLEGNSEVGSLQNLVIETLPADNFINNSDIHFSLVTGRIVLKK